MKIKFDRLQELLDINEKLDVCMADWTTHKLCGTVGCMLGNYYLAQAINIPPQPLADPSLEAIGVPELELEDPMGQVTSVSQLSDVEPTDWAFQARLSSK